MRPEQKKAIVTEAHREYARKRWEGTTAEERSRELSRVAKARWAKLKAKKAAVA